MRHWANLQHHHRAHPSEFKNKLWHGMSTAQIKIILPKASTQPHCGYSDHISVLKRPVYRLWVKIAKPFSKQIRVWPEGATTTGLLWTQKLGGETATYDHYTNVQEYAETVTAYINKCTNWYSQKDHGRSRRSGDKAPLRRSKANLSGGIWETKCMHTKKQMRMSQTTSTHDACATTLLPPPTPTLLPAMSSKTLQNN